VCETKEGLYIVQKKKAAGWRKDNSFPGSELGNQISAIEKRI